ncbi:MAG: hypothetical protein J6V54_06105 [Bacteroidales bacterium]|nr:hypothetical protein [Bacteroidales bacterium]
MNNFFGFDTANSFYDKRRHINLVYYSMMHLRLLSGDNSFIYDVKRIISSNNSSLEKAKMMRMEILTDYENSFLDYLQKRYNLSDNDYVTILSGESLTNAIVKSPAGYTSIENWELIIQIMYSTMLCGPSFQHLVQRFISEFLIPLSAGMRGVTLQRSTFRLISENLNICLEKGKRQWSDLPYIEKYIIDKIA